MSVVGYSTLEVIPSVVKLRANIEKQTASDMAAAGKTAGKKFGDAAGQNAATGFKGKLSGALKGYAPFAGLALAAGAGALFKSAISEASSLAESANKINVVFGDAAGQVNAFADAASEGLGQSDLQARNAAASFGVYGKAANLAGADLGEFATSLTGLSSDMASFFDTDIQTAIDAIGSGLRGEAEPLRQFGVLLDDATLRSEALKLGLVSTTKEALTPQQKVLAAYSSIMKQTKDAQGDFARTSDGLANSSRDLAADWADMRAELGAKLLPAMLTFVSVVKDDLLPGLSAAGGVVKDAVEGFNALPAPVKAAAGAFVALKVASALGLSGSIASGAAKASSAMDSLRIRTMLATDAYRGARTVTREFAGTTATVSSGVGRLSASMQGLRAASTGIGTGFRSAIGAIGGWNLAIVAATAALTLWWQQHNKAKQEAAETEARIQSLTATLDANTGAITSNTRATVTQRLEEEGLLKLAQEAGVALDTVTEAALGNQGAINEVQAAYDSALATFRETPTEEYQDLKDATSQLFFALHDVTGETESALSAGARLAEANFRSSTATGQASDAMASYADQLADTRGELERLMAQEDKRALRQIQQQRDAIALRETFRAAHEEAAKGKDVLFDESKAADANMSSLLDLAEQWANSSEKVRNAKGAYMEMREEFIKVAREMGATREQARDLANEKLIKDGADVPIRFRSEGYRERLAEIAALKKAAVDDIFVRFERFGIDGEGHAAGGLIGGRGTGTSDSNLAWLSRGEFVQPAATVDYYGAAFMEALRKRLIPRIPGYAQGGLNQPSRAPAAPGGVQVHIGQVVAHDYRDFMGQMQRRTGQAMADGVRFG